MLPALGMQQATSISQPAAAPGMIATLAETDPGLEKLIFYCSGYFGRVARSCSQATSLSSGTLYGSNFVESAFCGSSGGIVLESSHRWISEWPSAKEKPQARWW